MLCVGRLSKKSRPLCDHYVSLLRPYANIDIREIDGALPSEGVEQAVIREGAAILRRIRPSALAVALDHTGREFRSVEFSLFLAEQKLHGVSDFQFILGGAFGLDARVLAAANLVWSLSLMTFPHQLARVIVLEQLYRAIRIERGEPYHY